MRDLLVYLALRLGVGIVGWLPSGAVRRMGSVAGWLWYVLAPRRRAMALRHMSRVLGEDADIESAAKAVFRSYGRYYAEALWFRPRRIDHFLSHTTVDGIELVDKARDDGKGMIYALPHMGNWEVAAPIASERNISLVAVAEKLRNRRITDWFTQLRGRLGIEIVLATGAADVMRRLEEALSKNKAVALLSDRDLKGRGVEVEFFGETTTLPPGPATLALRTGAPLIPVATYFTASGHHVYIGDPLEVAGAPNRPEQVSLMTRELARRLEDLIRRAPEQWHLVQPNWPSDRGGPD